MKDVSALVARRKRYFDGVTGEITTKWFSLYAITSLDPCGCMGSVRNVDNAREIGRGNDFSRIERRIFGSAFVDNARKRA
ncbi:hypothetical protein ALC56_14828 [Trachymyrmex septentrionalis]|uniref:Uncharacterized protein n=1 Tax=Trachymyrmex septentrionalis TaxID=34720 RepID=A0A195ES65_9HYME|nr:hypothetical protein ALC56_14828 [Trachymyrmex septentrionalis]